MKSESWQPEFAGARAAAASRCSLQQEYRAGFPGAVAIAGALGMTDYSVSGRFHADAIAATEQLSDEQRWETLLAALRSGRLDPGRRKVLRMRVLTGLAELGASAATLLDAGASEREISTLENCGIRLSEGEPETMRPSQGETPGRSTDSGVAQGTR